MTSGDELVKDVPDETQHQIYPDISEKVPSPNETVTTPEKKQVEELEIRDPESKDEEAKQRLNNMRKINCIRVFIMVYNLAFLVLGVIVLIVGIYLLVSGDDISFSGSTFLSGSIIVIIVSLVLLGLSVFGLVAAVLPFHALLWIYAGLMCVVLAVEIAIGVWGFAVRDDIVFHLREEFQVGIAVEFGNDNHLYVGSIIAVQDGFDCCGYYGYRDWDTSTYLNSTFYGQSFRAYPQSCCDSDFFTFRGHEYCNATVLKALSVPGCQTHINTYAHGIVFGVGIIGVVLALIQTVGILMALFLSCYKRKYEDIKLKMMPSFKE